MKSRFIPLLATVLCLLVATHAALAVSTFVVNNTNDSGAGSLRQAILDANGTPNSGGPDLINFAIPGGGVKTISPTSAFPTITDPVVIDGTTQGVSATPLIELDGTGAGASVDGLIISAGGSTLKGLAINRFGGDGLILHTNGGNTIQRTFIGTNPSGTIALGTTFTGLFIDGSPNNLIGGTGAGEGNVISASGFSGIAIAGPPSIGNQVKGNLIGTDVTGTLAFPNSSGIYLGPTFEIHPGTSSNTTIGGSEPGAGNVISGNDGQGIIIFDAANTGNLVQGNFIGTNAAGTGPLGNSREGIKVEHSSNNMIGGTALGAGNLISGNDDDGVRIFGAPALGNQVLGNRIYNNAGAGIDLGINAVAQNDPGDGDTGPNNLQNYPVLTSANSSGGNTTIQGSLNSTANTTFHVEFFSNSACEPSGNGEGQTFLGASNITTVGNDATINVVLPVAVTGGQFITATATDPANNTSEFSACVTATGTGPSPTPTASPTPGSTPSKLLNIATRMRVQTGENVIIGGFIITGTDSKNVIIRGIGPSLSAFFSGSLANPTLELFQGETLVMGNNDWRESQQTQIEATGLQPTNDLESAIVQTLAPGSYTAVLRGLDNTTGIGVVEAYDLNQTANSKFANIATRGFVEAGDNVMIGGFIVGPASSSNSRVVVRAIGPTLTAFGIPGALQDPTVELKDASGTTLSSNDNWQEGQPTELQQLNLAPPNAAESALVAIVPPGSYTAIVRGAGNTAGVALVEVYHIQSSGGGGGAR